MPLLALDTATSAPVIALVGEDGSLLAGRVADGRAQAVLVELEGVFEDAGIERADVTAVVVGTGPGTFTGLRVGVATARGIAETLGVPLHGSSSLAVVAASHPEVPQATIAAGRGECFVQRFDSWSEPAGPVQVVAASEAPDPQVPTPEGLARVATVVRAHALEVGEAGSPLAVVPAYGREPDATPPRMDWRMDELRADDIDQLLVLEARCFEEPWSRFMYEEELRRPADERVQLAVRDSGANDRLVGAALAARIGDEWHVMNVLVDPVARRRGIGRALMAALLERGTAIDARVPWLLEVRDGNEGAIALYEQLGFRQLGRRRGYYQDTGEDALVLALGVGGR